MWRKNNFGWYKSFTYCIESSLFKANLYSTMILAIWKKKCIFNYIGIRTSDQGLQNQIYTLQRPSGRIVAIHSTRT